jgi:hypothetical protein
MSDFLSQLAERALALPPMVRPRLQSIYEPPAASVLQNPLEEHVEVPAEPPRGIESAHEQTLQSPDEKAGAEQAREAVDQKPAAARERKVKPQAPSEQPVLTKRDAPRPPPLPHESESAGKIKTAEPKTPPHRMTRKDDRQLDRMPTAAAKQPITPREGTKTHSAERLVESDLEAHTPPTQKESAQPQTFSHESKPRVEKPAMHPIAVTVRSAQQPRQEHARSTLPLTPAQREGSPRASAPAVHVTIGRVEVRAVMPPMATPKIASPATPKLSLEDYLKQRRSA